ncbi:carbohydrate ABC transporter permease [Demetria terragena]|uniref:carbohydrate ABC transporter permease n=1 Tax=Demetria terragena TaxID=63959 RepID=UPI00035C8E95|nr:sugar ABC transporter permease [Demetria terragena]
MATATTSAQSAKPRPHIRWSRGMPMLPTLVILLLFLAGPVLYSVYLAFTNRALRGEGASETSFVGLDNFTQAFDTSAFWNSFTLTIIFTLVSGVIGQTVLGMALALLLRRAPSWVQAITGAVVVGAWIVPEVVAGYLWYTFLSEDGSLNNILDLLHLPSQDWLISAPIIAVSFANIWRGTAFAMLTFSAALAQISPELEESAQIDGAGPIRRFWSITLPLLRRAMMTALMLITLQTLSVFGLIYVMTGGGPSAQSQTLPLYMYEQAFSYGQLGYGTAIALLLLGIGGIAALAYLRVLPKEDKE